MERIQFRARFQSGFSARRGVVAVAALMTVVAVWPSCKAAAQSNAQDVAPVVTTASPCEAFSKNADGSWTAKRPATVKIGTSSVTVAGASTYARRAINVNGVDLATFLDDTCSAAKP